MAIKAARFGCAASAESAFWFDDKVERDALSLDGRYLPLTDIIAMGNEILTLCGYGGAATAAFRGSR